MRLANIRRADGKRILAIEVEGRGLLDASLLGFEDIFCIREVYERGEGVLTRLTEAVATAPASALLNERRIFWLPVCEADSKIFCVGLNYVGHAEELGLKIPKYPSIFSRYGTTCVGHEQPILLPKSSDAVDWEGELALVIGRPIKNVGETESRSALAGVTCFNDVSMRDFQERLPRITLAKNFDASGPMGPFLVTMDEVGSIDDLTLETRVNGITRQSASTKEFIFGVDYLINLISQVCLLRPGDVIATGTPGGVGWAEKPPTYLKAGDVVEVEIEKVGILRNYTIVEG